jgi:hypothetical protein
MASECFYDEGEERWETKIHVGAGNVLLAGYHNTDIAGLLADDYPEQAHKNLTGIKDYYAHLEGTISKLPTRRGTYVDELCSMDKLNYGLKSVDKIVAVQCFEHLTPKRAIDCIVHWWGILKFGGIALVTVPDMMGIFEMLKYSPTREFAIRHLTGSGRDNYNWHMAWYTQETLTELFTSIGFQVEPIENPHVYPAICIRCHKHENLL